MVWVRTRAVRMMGSSVYIRWKNMLTPGKELGPHATRRVLYHWTIEANSKMCHETVDDGKSQLQEKSANH
jgi:hypothetical protein